MTLVFRGEIEEGISLIYQTDFEVTRQLVPDPFEPVLKDGAALWHILACRVNQMRPAGLPQWCGINFPLVTYRILVRFRSGTGKIREGLHVVRTDAGRGLAAVLGNQISDFHFRHSDIRFEQRNACRILTVDSAPEAEGNAFLSFASRPAIHTGTFVLPASLFHWNPIQQRVDVTEITERITQTTPIRIREAHWNLFRTMELSNHQLLSASLIFSADCFWRTGDYLYPVTASALQPA